MIINLIAAVGASGQLGLKNDIPWNNHKPSQDRYRLDLRRFSELTYGSDLIVGHKTASTLLNIDMIRSGRRLCVYDKNKFRDPDHFLEEMAEKRENIFRNGTPVWLIGGEKTYKDFAPYVNGNIIISVIREYDEDADTWFPFDAYGMKFLR